MKDIQPYLIKEHDAVGEQLYPVPPHDKLFSESWLQEILFKHPSLLPVSFIDDAYAPIVSIGREIASIDNLFISPAGLLTVVETKLWRNPEAHRTVVAQILDYAKTLAAWNYEKLNEAVKSFTLRRFNKSLSIYNLVKEKIHDFNISEIEFQDNVQDCLQCGKFALLIVGDKILPGATQLAETIQSAPHLEFTLNLAEIRFFKLNKESDWPVVAFPQVIAKTNEITRAVVKVVYEEKKPDVRIDTPDETTAVAGSTSLSEFIAALPSDISELFKSHIEGWVKADYTVYWGKVGFSLRIPWNGKLTTVFDAYPVRASILQDNWAKEYDFPIEIFRDYKTELMRSPVISSTFATGKKYIHYDNMSTDELALLLNTTDTLTKALFEKSNND